MSVSAKPCLWRKRGVYYARVRLGEGTRKPISLRTADRDEAVARLRELELLGDAEWMPQASRRRSVSSAARAFMDAAAHACSVGTQEMYEEKLANVTRILGDRPVAAFSREWTLELIARRLAERAHRHTIAKELTALRGLLAEAMARGWLRSISMRALVPRFRSGYVPCERAPTPEQAQRLLAALHPKRRTWVLLALTGLRRGEIEHLAAEHVGVLTLTVPGSKTRRARRVLPRPTFLSDLGARGSASRVVERWTNVCRDLTVACRRAEVPRFTPNDLRRAFATWLRAAGVAHDVIARLLGHAPGSTVTGNVYALTPPHELVDAMARLPDLDAGERPGPSSVVEMTSPGRPLVSISPTYSGPGEISDAVAMGCAVALVAPARDCPRPTGPPRP